MWSLPGDTYFSSKRGKVLYSCVLRRSKKVMFWTSTFDTVSCTGKNIWFQEGEARLSCSLVLNCAVGAEDHRSTVCALPVPEGSCGTKGSTNSCQERKISYRHVITKLRKRAKNTERVPCCSCQGSGVRAGGLQMGTKLWALSSPGTRGTPAPALTCLQLHESRVHALWELLIHLQTWPDLSGVILKSTLLRGCRHGLAPFFLPKVLWSFSSFFEWRILLCTEGFWVSFIK